MEKLPFFYFKEHSSLDFGLYIKEKGVHKGAQRDLTYIPVAGRDGDVIIDNGSFKNVSIPYKLELLNDTQYSFSEIAHLIRNWLLSEPGYFELWDTYDPERFRLASFDGEVNIEQELRQYGQLDITFNCKPYRYLRSGLFKVSGSTSVHLINPENYESKPYLKIYGTGTCYVYVNSKDLCVKDVNEYVEIDSEIMDCYKGNTPLNNKMTGSFPVLQPGANTISAGIGVSRIEIIPRWCTI